MENNRLIAEFMGGTINSSETLIDIGNTINCGKSIYNRNGAMQVGLWPINDLRYHESWDWLMPVVNKINNTGTADGILYDLFNAIKNVDIEKAHKEVVTFIKWYNKNK